MDNLVFDYNSPRAKKARFAVKIEGFWMAIISILMIILFVTGLAVCLFGYSVGWFIFGLSFVPAMIVEWANRELLNQPIKSDSKNIDDLIDSKILGRLSKSPNPRELAKIVSQTSAGQFILVRFGLSFSFLNDICSDEQNEMHDVWRTAGEIFSKLECRNISAPILILSLIKQNKNYVSLLRHLQLSEDDLISGIKWHEHLNQVIDKHMMPKRTGGLARDLSFGYIPSLSKYAENISQQVGVNGSSLIELESHISALNQLIEIFSKNGRQNAVLVGPDGVGKTEVVKAFASKILAADSDIPSFLKFSQVIMLNAGSLIASAPDRGALEKLVPKILDEALLAKNVIVFLDDAEAFFSEGIGKVNIIDIVKPYINSGALRMILSMDDQECLKLSKINPSFESILNNIHIKPASEFETMLILQDKIINEEYKNKVIFTYQAIREVYKLSSRYLNDFAMPGSAVKLLQSAVRYQENSLVSVNSVQKSIEETFDVKIGSVDNDSEREKLLNMEKLIHRRMINQTRAVSVVCDAIRRARAGIRNQNRPIGTFLFLGPTGVGKTELAKSLADVYFGGEDNLVRFDMNEFINDVDAERLIANAVDNPNSLTAQISKKPFSVVLLDEIEKAHPKVLLMLLQLLDEGIIRDVNDREISFRDAIIIATSNAGADIVREYIERGYDIEKFESQFVDQLIEKQLFRPEFINRFDEIVTFRPLNHDELLQVVDLMIAEVNRNIKDQKITITIDRATKDYLVNVGNDPKLGARPMRRIVQRIVENIVANKILTGEIESGSDVMIDIDQVQKFEAKNNNKLN